MSKQTNGGIWPTGIIVLVMIFVLTWLGGAGSLPGWEHLNGLSTLISYVAFFAMIFFGLRKIQRRRAWLHKEDNAPAVPARSQQPD